MKNIRNYLHTFSILIPIMLVAMIVATISCSSIAQKGSLPDDIMKNSANPIKLSYEVINTYPHDPDAFTQGLVYKDGYLYESTGRNGQSSIRRVELTTGRVLQKFDVAQEYFAEGLTIFNNRAYQLTWQNHIGFIYDEKTFDLKGSFNYEGEGWGLTHDGKSLILSDGTNKLRFLNPETFAVERTVDVVHDNRPVTQINEIEYVKGMILANIWQTDLIVIIDPQSGKIIGKADLSGLLPASDRTSSTDVLNGIAYDSTGDRLFVTGKLWSKLFQIKVKS